MNTLLDQPIYINILFIATTLLTAYFFYVAARRSKLLLLIILTILTVQAYAGSAGFFQNTSGMPPRFTLLIIPSILLIVWLFFSKKGKLFLNKLDQESMTLLHVVRIPVEITLYLLFLHKNVPELMTFAGRNFDILVGISAPIIYYLGYKKESLSNGVKLIWNYVSLAFLVFIVLNAALSIPSEFQQFAIDQPNIAVLNTPYVWLPGFIVPVALLCHLASIRQLRNPELVHKYPENKRSGSKKKRRR